MPHSVHCQLMQFYYWTEDGEQKHNINKNCVCVWSRPNLAGGWVGSGTSNLWIRSRPTFLSQVSMSKLYSLGFLILRGLADPIFKKQWDPDLSSFSDSDPDLQPLWFCLVLPYERYTLILIRIFCLQCQRWDSTWRSLKVSQQLLLPSSCCCCCCTCTLYHQSCSQ